jgi:hypothetical protein
MMHLDWFSDVLSAVIVNCLNEINKQINKK